MKMLLLMAISLSVFLLLGACADKESFKDIEKAPVAADTELITETAVIMPQTNLDQPAAEAIIVIVNGEEIDGTVYNNVVRQLENSLAIQGKKTTDLEIAEQVKEQALMIIVDNKLIIQDAVKKGHGIDEEILEQRFEELKNQFENEEQMTIALKKTGFTLDDMKQQFREQLIYESYLIKEIDGADVTEENLKEAYQGYIDSTEGETPAFEEMKPMILQSLENQNKKQAVYDRIKELRKAADIDIKI